MNIHLSKCLHLCQQPFIGSSDVLLWDKPNMGTATHEAQNQKGYIKIKYYLEVELVLGMIWLPVRILLRTTALIK